MSSRHQDESPEYIPLDDSQEQSSTRRTVLSAKYAGRLFLTALFSVGILLGGVVGRSFATPRLPSLISTPISSYQPVVTILDSFVDMYV